MNQELWNETKKLAEKVERVFSLSINTEGLANETMISFVADGWLRESVKLFEEMLTEMLDEAVQGIIDP